MSVAGNEITNVVDDERVDAETQKKHKDDDFGNGYSRKFSKAKRVVLSPLKKTKNRVFRPKNVEKISSSRSVGGKGCYFCFRGPETLDSSAESQTSDPNDPNFTFDMLKSLLETNDFYSKECNPHLDTVVASTGSSSNSVGVVDFCRCSRVDC